MSNMLMSVTREEALEKAITSAKNAQLNMEHLQEQDADEVDVEDIITVVRGWVDVADTWVSIAKELPGLPRRNDDRGSVQVGHHFPDLPITVRVLPE